MGILNVSLTNEGKSYMATIKEVAKLAGVSVSTVSIIINNKAQERKISPETQEKVFDVIKRLNYQPSVAAKRLRSNELNSYTVGIFWASDFRSSYLNRIMTGLQEGLVKAKIPLDIVICPYETGNLKLQHKKLYNTNSYNAILIANTSDEDDEYIHQNKISMPTILYNRQSDIYHTVCIDNELAGRKAARKLISSGAKNIAMLCHKKYILGMSKRSGGFYNECIENGIQIDEKNVYYVGSSISDGAEAAKEFINKKNIPEAIYCDSDSISQGLLYTFNRNNISVPKDVQVISIGLESKDFNNFYTPSITSVDIPLEKMAAKCIEIIEGVANHKITSKCHFTFDTELIERESTLNK